MSASFVHLSVHSEYSLVDSVVRIDELVAAAAAGGMPAVALTDQGNLFAAVKFQKAALRAGVQPIFGADLWLDESDDPEAPSRFSLLVQDREGYLNLSRLITRSYTEGQHRGQPRVQRAWLEGNTDGLIALSGGRAGDVGRACASGRDDLARTRLATWRDLFPGRYYLQVARTGRAGEEAHVHATAALGAASGVPLVAVNEVRFITADDFDAHEARVCIHDGRMLADPRRPRRYSDQQYLRSSAEMAVLFEDLPEALANTVAIAQRCAFLLDLGKTSLPAFPVPAGATTASYLRDSAMDGLKQRLEDNAPVVAESEYVARLDRELEVIDDMGFPGYFLIVADFCRWARENGVPVGPGRGSGAGSLVAWALGITDLDPIRYDLLFERFLNPERVSMPDFDIDFCMEGRDRVIDYVAESYGRDQVSQIITYGTMAARAVVRDTGRILGHGFGFVDRVAKLVPPELGMTLAKALEDEDLKREYKGSEEIREWFDLAMKLEGLARNAGKHAGGVVIAPSPLTDFMPLYCEEGSSQRVAQFDKDDVESIGLVKFDFLGLRTLTVIDRAVRTVKGIDLAAVPLDDPATFALLKRCETTAVFQLESRGMRDLVKRLQPDDFEEIVALMALFRPGPLQSGMVEDFINRKHGREPVNYPHPLIEQVLKPTYGVILYQEQVMQIARVLSGYTLGAADLLRRAMGKKKPEEMAQQRSIFVEGAVANGVPEHTAGHIFDLIEHFAGYGFNRSHSAAYAMLSYHTAWLKCHHPAAFMAAVLSTEMDFTDRVVVFIDECSRMGLEVLPPDINASGYDFTVAGDIGIRYGLGAIRGVGRAAIEVVTQERESGGPFQDLVEFCQRVGTGKLNKRMLEALIKSGAMDALGASRAHLAAQLPHALRLAEQHGMQQATGQEDLFGLGDGGSAAAVPLVVPDQVVVEWDEAQRLAAEKETLGLYLTGHPIQRYEEELRHIVSGKLAELAAEAGEGDDGRERWQRKAKARQVTLAGLIVDVRKRNGRTVLTLDDRSGRVELPLFDDTPQRHRDLVTRDRLLVVEGQVVFDEFIGGHRVSQKAMYDIGQAREEWAKRIELDWDGVSGDTSFVRALQAALKPSRHGGCPVRVNYRGRTAAVPVDLGPDWRIRPDDELLERLAALAGSVRVVYDLGTVTHGVNSRR